MPKQVWKIERFDGGLNSNSDARDIDDTELSETENIMVDSIGRIRTMGEFVAHDAGTHTTAMTAGYGLFEFSHDRVGGQSAGSSQNETGDDYLMHYDAPNSQIDIYSRSADAWGTNVIDLGSSASGKPCFYQADGAVRVSDGNFGSGNRNKWYGYIKQTHFNGLSPGGAADSYDGWYAKNTDFAAPTEGVSGKGVVFTDTTSAGSANTYIEYIATGISDIFQYWTRFDGRSFIAVGTTNDQARMITRAATTADDGGLAHDNLVTHANSDSGNDWNGENIEIYPPTGTGFNIYANSSSTAGSWRPGTWLFGTTFIYQGGQESNIYDITAVLANSNRGISYSPGAAMDVQVLATSPYDPFIIGGRAYIRKTEDEPWVLLVDISLKEGIRPDLTSDYESWTLSSAVDDQHNSVSDNVYCTASISNIINPSPWTYKAINGYNPDDAVFIGANGEGFKTAVVTNRKTYIGNVRRVLENGETETQSDAMYKSMPGKFDTFPISRKIEASIRDGDEIVKLEEYADRILQFKKHKMHLINISQDVEFLEDTFEYKGIQHPACACKTDYGIAWVNKSGVYLYNGQSVISLLEKKGRPIISTIGSSDESWTGFTSTYTQSIGYLPNKRQIMVFDSITSAGAGKIFLYDIPTQSWVNSKADLAGDEDRSNFITDWSGDLVWTLKSSSTVLTKKWSDTSADNPFSIKTKDIDFGQPSVRKKIHRVRISYKGNANSINIRYRYDGIVDDFSFQEGNTPFADKDTDQWYHLELKPTAGVSSNNIYSFKLYISGTPGDANFQINDISIIYRTKNVK